MTTMSMPPAVEAYTVQDYLQWEGDWELIHGQPVARVPSPSFDHQQVSAAVFRQLDESLDACPHCQAVFEVDVEFAQDIVVRPDVLVIRYQPESERLTRAPDLIFEVISPKTSRRDEVVKFDLYHTEGVPHSVLFQEFANMIKHWILAIPVGAFALTASFRSRPTTSRFSKRKMPSLSNSST